MVAFGNYWENLILKQYFNVESGATSDLYLGLSSHNPTDDGSGVSEPPISKGYSRFKTTSGSGTSWEFQALPTGVTVTNGVTIDFSRASTPWGTMAYFGLFNGNASGASLCSYGALGVALDIGAYDIVRFNKGEITIGTVAREESLSGLALSTTYGVGTLTTSVSTQELEGMAIAISHSAASLVAYFTWEDTTDFEFEDTSGFEWKDE